METEANLRHIQIDDFTWPCEPDAGGADFFFHDLTWRTFSSGTVSLEAIHAETNITVTNLETLRDAMDMIITTHAPRAIAMKTQHAYDRTLRWQSRSDADAARVLARLIGEQPLTIDEQNCLGDWCLARGVELAIKHNLPIKIHTGYYAKNHRMPIDFINPSHLWELLATYPEARFVLMHMGYPYEHELLALAKHYPNVWVDMCWAWSINPYAAMTFVREFLHSVPMNKLFAFGADVCRPWSVVAYAEHARSWINRTLQAGLNDGDFNESQALIIAESILQKNALTCFDVDNTLKALQQS